MTDTTSKETATPEPVPAGELFILEQDPTAMTSLGDDEIKELKDQFRAEWPDARVVVLPQGVSLKATISRE